eukprot:SAG31_NODE_5916_length_2257_cov_1.160334_2_plen_308_part_00
MTGFRRLQMLRILLIFWRLLVQHARDKKDPEFVENLVLLKAEEDNPEKRRRLTTPHQEAFLKKTARRPLAAVAILTRYIHTEYENRNITNMEYQAMNKNLNMLIQGFNGVDKVHTVQIPFPYAQMILLFLTLYVFSAPFMFVALFGWACFLPASALCCAFFGINEVALEIEDPFGEDENDLPLDPMGDALKADIECALEMAEVPLDNISTYWDEIHKSKDRWAKLEQARTNQAREAQVNQKMEEGLVGSKIPKLSPEPEPENDVVDKAAPQNSSPTPPQKQAGATATSEDRDYAAPKNPPKVGERED